MTDPCVPGHSNFEYARYIEQRTTLLDRLAHLHRGRMTRPAIYAVALDRVAKGEGDTLDVLRVMVKEAEAEYRVYASTDKQGLIGT